MFSILFFCYLSLFISWFENVKNLMFKLNNFKIKSYKSINHCKEIHKNKLNYIH